MEKRLLIAIVVSFLVIFLWQALFVKKQPPQPPPPSQQASKATDRQPEVKTALEKNSTQQEKESGETEEFQPLTEMEEGEISILTSLYQATWSNKGAVLKSWKLKKHKNSNKEDLELISQAYEEVGLFPFMVETEDSTFDQKVNNALYTFTSRQILLEDGETQELRFIYADEKGTKVEKKFNFYGGKYSFDIEINVWKNGHRIEPHLLWGPGFTNLSPEKGKRTFGGEPGIAVYVGDKLFFQDEKKFKPEQSSFNFVRWVAYKNNYFAALFLTSPQKASSSFRKIEREGENIFYFTFSNPEKGFIGPKELDALNEFGYNAKKLIQFGFFGWMAEILLKALKGIHNAIPNWGLSIIILTFLIKLIFFPLTFSSTKSMAKMQEIQPKIKALRAKYKKAKQDIAQRRKMNEEMMKLYKEHGINPAGGCLPILIQLPIFWGFFRVLAVSIEFRHSPFLLWIKDLSVKDPYYVTPILMGITQYISQKMTPTSADPTQQRMMLILPVIMTVFFMNFQSGLVLYWLTNNVLQIGQQHIMNRLMKKKKRVSHGKKGKK